MRMNSNLVYSSCGDNSYQPSQTYGADYSAYFGNGPGTTEGNHIGYIPDTTVSDPRTPVQEENAHSDTDSSGINYTSLDSNHYTHQGRFPSPVTAATATNLSNLHHVGSSVSSPAVAAIYPNSEYSHQTNPSLSPTVAHQTSPSGIPHSHSLLYAHHAHHLNGGSHPTHESVLASGYGFMDISQYSQRQHISGLAPAGFGYPSQLSDAIRDHSCQIPGMFPLQVGHPGAVNSSQHGHQITHQSSPQQNLPQYKWMQVKRNVPKPGNILQHSFYILLA